MRRHSESCVVGTLECTSGRELLTVVDACNLTVVYSTSRSDTRRPWNAAVPKHCWWFSARAPGTADRHKAFYFNCLALGHRIAIGLPNLAAYETRPFILCNRGSSLSADFRAG